MNQLMSTRTLALEALTACPVCAGQRAEFVLSHPDGYLPSLRLHRCRQCDLIYLNPRLTLESILAVEAESEVYSFDRSVAEQWIAEDLTGWVVRLERFVSGPERRLLDIGCNRGLLMEAARRRGWQVTGVEIVSKAALRAREEYNLTVFASLTELDPQMQFDLITVWHVLEHTLEPVDFLQQAVSRLAPTGVLALQVPSFDFLDEFRNRKQLSSLLCAVHTCYFTSATLQTVMARAGLAVAQIENDAHSLLLTVIGRPSSSPLLASSSRWVKPDQKYPVRAMTDQPPAPTLENTGERLIPDEEANSLNYQVHRSRYEFARQFLRGDGAVLDYGCGAGYGLHSLAQATSGRCVGVDKPESIAYAAHRYPHAHIEYVAADITQPVARFGQFDLIVSFDVIEHMPDIDTYLANIAAQLRNDQSVALISTPWSYRRNNLTPAHNPYHECELTATEFFARLDPYFTIDRILLTLGMMACVRRKGAQDNGFAAMRIEISGAHLGALEEAIEQLSTRVEMLEPYPVAVWAASRRLPNRQSVGAAPRTVVVGERTYRVRPLTTDEPVMGHFVAQSHNLAALDLPLALSTAFSHAQLQLTLLCEGQRVAQVNYPALLLQPDQPQRFLFAPIPHSNGLNFEWLLSITTGSDDGAVAAWCDNRGNPLMQEYYRRYRWEGSPKYSTVTEHVSLRPQAWLADWPHLWPQALAQGWQPDADATGQCRIEQQILNRSWPPDAWLLTKLFSSLQQHGLRATAAEIVRYLRWRVRRT
jgi:2-polyprenyl-3-methyl-5-hydroxy-6-metoxy-1,4-benzoquinol methylase